MRMIREENPGLESLTSREVESYSLGHRPLEAKDFDSAFGNIKPAMKAADLEKYDEWSRDFGG
ncbi:MAG: hypothetical protein HY518_02655 [Candidatus Aenigmarchaeota archaeon]|nr:hypothetical protein [Candidatus Aenigmarchaeota archaeon]